MCIRDRRSAEIAIGGDVLGEILQDMPAVMDNFVVGTAFEPVSYTHLRAHETVLDIVCRLLLEKKNTQHLDKDCDKTQLSNTLILYHIQ